MGCDYVQGRRKYVVRVCRKVLWCGVVCFVGSTIRWMKDKGWSEVYRALVACNSDCLALMFDDRSQYKLVGLHDCPRRRKLMTVWRDCVA